MINCEDIAFLYHGVEEYDYEIRKIKYYWDCLYKIRHRSDEFNYPIPEYCDKLSIQIICLELEKNRFIREYGGD